MHEINPTHIYVKYLSDSALEHLPFAIPRLGQIILDAAPR